MYLGKDVTLSYPNELVQGAGCTIRRQVYVMPNGPHAPHCYSTRLNPTKKGPF